MPPPALSGPFLVPVKFALPRTRNSFAGMLSPGSKVLSATPGLPSLER
jgi:hypothetical protein